ncbi:MAG: hypothetical protein P9L88_01080 [Candidatus Tantalella remota]|nr:hypothetical protein [Candidatus Tantalella remota]
MRKILILTLSVLLVLNVISFALDGHILSVKLSSLGIKRDIILSPPGVSSNDPAAIETRNLMYAISRMLHRPDDSQEKVIEAIDEEMKNSTTLQKTKKRDRRFKPGRSPEDALAVIALNYEEWGKGHSSEDDNEWKDRLFSLEEYHGLYSEYRRFLGFERLPEKSPDSQSRRDLNGLVGQGYIEKDSTGIADRWKLTAKGIKKVKQMPERSFLKVSPEARNIVRALIGDGDVENSLWRRSLVAVSLRCIMSVEGGRAIACLVEAPYKEIGKDMIKDKRPDPYGEASEAERDEGAAYALSEAMGLLDYTMSTRTDLGENWDREKAIEVISLLLEYTQKYKGLEAVKRAVYQMRYDESPLDKIKFLSLKELLIEFFAASEAGIENSDAAYSFRKTLGVFRVIAARYAAPAGGILKVKGFKPVDLRKWYDKYAEAAGTSVGTDVDVDAELEKHLERLVEFGLLEVKNEEQSKYKFSKRGMKEIKKIAGLLKSGDLPSLADLVPIPPVVMQGDIEKYLLDEQKGSEAAVSEPVESGDVEDAVVDLTDEDLKALFALPAGVTGSIDETTMRNVWESVKLARERGIEVLVPATLTVDGSLERAIRNINRKRDNINIRRFDENNLATLLARNDDNAERIIISDDNTNRFIWSMVAEEGKAESFKGVRLINVRMPEQYANPAQRIAYQSRMLTIAILARLLDTGEDATPSVEAVLREMLENNTDLAAAELDSFIERLGAPASSDTDASSIVHRISYFLDAKKAVKLIRTLERQWLITREFWTYA